MKITLIQVGYGYSKEYKGYYARYKVLIDGEPIQSKFTKEELKKLPYWVNRSGVMAMAVWGTNQEYEAKYSLARFLGWDKDGDLNEKIRQINVIY